MKFGNRLYWVAGLVAILALAGAAVTLTSQLTSADGPSAASEVEDGDVSAGPGQIDDGRDLLPEAGITLDAAIAAAQSAASGSIGEVDLEHWNDTLVFNVDVGDKDVKVDAATGAVLSTDQDD
jgi:uncharacterized membrane protein YkoI